MHSKVIQDIMAKHGVEIFQLFAEDLFTYRLKTLEPPSPELIADLKKVLSQGAEITHELIRYSVFEPSGLKEVLEANEVDHPSHYASGKIEVIEAIEDWGLGFHRGNAVKYIARAGKKDPEKEIQDLEKAIWYAKREIELLKAAKEERSSIRPNDMAPKSPPVRRKPDLVVKGTWIVWGEEIMFQPHEKTVSIDLSQHKALIEVYLDV